MLRLESQSPLLKTSVWMPGDCTVTNSERTTHLGLRGDLKLPCLLIPFQAFRILFELIQLCHSYHYCMSFCRQVSIINLRLISACVLKYLTTLSVPVLY